MNGTASEITRQIMGNVPRWMAISFYAAVTMACVWSFVQFYLKFARHRRGRAEPTKPESRQITLAHRVLSGLSYVVFHRQLMRDRYAGIAHILLFYGFTVLFIGTCLVFLEHDTPLHFFYGQFYLIASLIIDLGGIAFLVGVGLFLYRRMRGDNPRILQQADVTCLLLLLLAIGVTGFLLEGTRIAVDLPEFERWSIVGYTIAVVLNAIGVEGQQARDWHRFWWAVHAIVCIAFFALVSWKFFSHMLFAPIAWALRPKRSWTTLRPVELNLDSGVERNITAPGANGWNDFPWVDLLQSDACTTCGRCNSVCPANAAGKPLRPREIVLGVREAMNHQNDASLSHFLDDDAIWSCTTCAACNSVCPVGIEVYDKIVERRRGIVEVGVVPDNAVSRLESLTDQFNPFERPAANRLDWAAGMMLPVATDDEPIELLYWVGCAGSFDPAGQSVSRAMIKILNHLGVSYRVLGKRERCNGDPARRMGEEGLYQELALANIAMLKHHGVARVLTHCPHCFNVFTNEYPQLDEVTFEVEHHSQFLSRMIAAGKLTAIDGDRSSTRNDSTITFHDPCYLGRGNGIVSPPREVLNSLPVLQVEMKRSGCDSSCCGAGGGSMWLDVNGEERIENQRAREAAETGADLLVTGCPFCKPMLDAGLQSFDNEVSEVVDLAELVVRTEGL